MYSRCLLPFIATYHSKMLDIFVSLCAAIFFYRNLFFSIFFSYPLLFSLLDFPPSKVKNQPPLITLMDARMSADLKMNFSVSFALCRAVPWS